MDAMVVSDGLVIASGTSADAGTVVSAHRVSDGKLVWQQSYNCQAIGPALVVGGRVIFAACNSSGSKLVLQADSLSSGKRLWRRSGDWQVVRGDLSGPAGKNVFALSGGSVVDLSPKTGATRYTLTGATSVLAAGPSEVYADCSAADVCGYRLTNGHRLWRASIGTQQFAAEAGGVLYLSDGQALNAGTGAQLRYIWHGAAATAIAVGEGRIAVAKDPRVLDLYGLPGS